VRLSYAAKTGRLDGRRQVGPVEDRMLGSQYFPTVWHWQAYVTGFYRAAGHPGTSNRSSRRHRKIPIADTIPLRARGKP
jgi:hypothetical protein